jgi:hypothetical protein
MGRKRFLSRKFLVGLWLMTWLRSFLCTQSNTVTCRRQDWRLSERSVYLSVVYVVKTTS